MEGFDFVAALPETLPDGEVEALHFSADSLGHIAGREELFLNGGGELPLPREAKRFERAGGVEQVEHREEVFCPEAVDAAETLGGGLFAMCAFLFADCGGDGGASLTEVFSQTLKFLAHLAQGVASVFEVIFVFGSAEGQQAMLQ